MYTEIHDEIKEFVEEVSFGKRLKELMKENNGNNKPMSQTELQKELFEKNGNEDLVTTATISNWICGKSGLRKNKDEILEYLSEIFKVDIAYLNCTQVDKKNNNSINEFRHIHEAPIEDFYENEKLFGEYLKTLGITFRCLSVQMKPIGYRTIIQDSKIYKIKAISYHRTSYEISYKGKKIKKTYQEFQQIKKDITTFILFSFNKSENE